MNNRGRNILPMIGFIMIIGLLLGGFALARSTKARKLLDDNSNKGSTQTQTNKSIFDFGKDGILLDRYTVDESKDLSMDGVDKITITSVSSKLNIYYGNSDKINAKYYGSMQTSGKDAVPYLEVVKEGREAVIRIKYPVWYNVSLSEQTTLDVTIPEKLDCDFDINNTSGSISAQELKGGNISIGTISGAISQGVIKGKDIEIKSTSGSINAESIDASGDFKCSSISGKCTIGSVKCEKADLNSTSGSINFNDVTSDDISARSISGSIDLVLKRGSADIDTTSGKIKVKFVEGFDKVKIKSISGKVTLSIPEDSQFEADIQTLSGSISCSDFSMKISSTKRNELKATAGNGSSRVNINTSSGGVEIIKN